MKKNNFGFSIIFAMGFVAVISLIVIVLIEYLIPFGKNIKGSENSVNAYYQSLAGIEKALFEKKNLDIGTNASGSTIGKQSFDFKIDSNTTSFLPKEGEGDSEYDSNWNKIGIGNPIQLKLKNKDIDWSKVEFYFRVPDLDGDGSHKNLEKINGDDKIITWQITGSGFTLIAYSGSIIKTSDIDGSEQILEGYEGIIVGTDIKKEKIIGDHPIMTFANFYAGNGDNSKIDNYSENLSMTACKDTTCTLKLSVINDLIVKQNSKNQKIPYLEYKINFDNSFSVPTRFFRIKSAGYSYGFKKEINIKIPQYTTNQALDFAVFQ